MYKKILHLYMLLHADIHGTGTLNVPTVSPKPTIYRHTPYPTSLDASIPRSPTFPQYEILKKGPGSPANRYCACFYRLMTGGLTMQSFSSSHCQNLTSLQTLLGLMLPTQSGTIWLL